MFWTKVLVLSVVGAIIGWLTNVFAIKLIFRPLNPVNIPILNMKIQGLIPKRKGELARSIGQTVETELISIEEILEKIIHKENKTEIIIEVKSKIKKIVEQKIPSLVPITFRNMIVVYVDEIIEEEGENVLDELSQQLIHKATDQVKIAEIVEEKINEFELDKLEKIIIGIAQKELKHIELLGALIGFIIGFLQGLIVLQL